MPYSVNMSATKPFANLFLFGLRDLALGESGRGRHRVEIITTGGDATPDHVVRAIRVSDGLVHLRTGGAAPLLLAVGTNPGYSRGCSGSATGFGEVTEIACGRWAYGDAGRTGSGTDHLFGITGPAVVYVRRSTIFLADQREVRRYSEDELLRVLVEDSDAWPRSILSRALAGAVGERAEFLLGLLAQVEAAEAAAEVEQVPAQHYGVTRVGLERLGLTVGFDVDALPGRGLALSGTIVIAGAETLALCDVSPGGGKRWSCGAPTLVGLDVIREEPDGSRGTDMLCRVASPDWSLTYIRSRDGEPHTQVCHSAAGRRETVLEDDRVDEVEPTAKVSGRTSSGLGTMADLFAGRR